MEASVLPSKTKQVLALPVFDLAFGFNCWHSETLFQTMYLYSFPKTLHTCTSESSRKIRNNNKTLSVRFESCGHLIKSIKLKKRPSPCEMAPVICVRKKWYVSS